MQDNGGRFAIIVREAIRNPLDFSVILAVMPQGSSLWFRLRRHNGKSHEHTNSIEGDSFYDFHIHMASERYQDLGMKEDAYAEPTVRYGDRAGALRCLCADAGVALPADGQAGLFPGEEL